MYAQEKMTKVIAFYNNIGCIFKVKDNLFKDNYADEKGGVIVYNQIRPEGLLENTFVGNYA